MTYSENKLENIITEYKKQKSFTLKINLITALAVVFLVVLLFFVRHILIAFTGGLVSLFLFSFIFYRVNEVHKKIKAEIDFYTDIVYSEKQTEDVIFLGYGEKVVSNKRNFNSIIVKMLKTEKQATLLYQEDYTVDFKPKRYTVVKAQNILIDYKEANND